MQTNKFFVAIFLKLGSLDRFTTLIETSVHQNGLGRDTFRMIYSTAYHAYEEFPKPTTALLKKVPSWGAVSRSRK